MKKVLFATTALVATASVAAADVSFSGYGRFGVLYTANPATAAVAPTAAQTAAATAAATAFTANPSVANLEALDAANAAAAGTPAAAATDSTDIVSRFRLQADVSTETDSGIGFNARMRIQVEENSTNDSNGIRFGMTMGNVAVNAGNINGVIESTPNLYMKTNSAGVGLEGNGFHSLATNMQAAGAGNFFNWTAYSSGGAGATNGVEVIYSANGLRLHAHSTEGDYGVGASYSTAGYTFGLGYEEDDNNDNLLLVTAGGSFGAFDVALAYAKREVGANDFDKTSIKAFYDVSAATNVYGFVSTEDAGEAFGLGVSHDLGGASFDAGYTRTALEADVVSAGVFFKF